jgi:hypothetical protein
MPARAMIRPAGTGRAQARSLRKAGAFAQAYAAFAQTMCSRKAKQEPRMPGVA